MITGGLGVAASAVVPTAAREDEGHRVLPVAAHDSRYAREWVQAVHDLTWRDDVATPLGTTPPNAARCYAYVVLAMSEAVVAGDTRLRSAGGQLAGLGTVALPRGRVDWTCPEGSLPPVGGGHGEEPPETDRTQESVRQVFADPAEVTLTVDKKLGSARLVGTLVVTDHEGETQGQPPVDVTWTGLGTSSRQTSDSTYTDDLGVRFTGRTTETFREGDVEGRIGGMIVDDEAGESSQGGFGTFRSEDRGSTP